MSLLPQQYLKAVVHIKTESGKGTGFLIGIKNGLKNEKGEDFHELFIVTNCHVVNAKRQITIRFDSNKGPEEISLSGGDKDWIMCAKKDVDLAVIHVNHLYLSGMNIDYTAIFEEDMFTDKSTFQELIEVGHEVFLLGFPLGISGISKNHPIARQGIVARCDDELLFDSKFLLDINNFPGNSGGPIFVKPSLISLEGKNPIKKSFLIGLICSYLPYSKQLFDHTTDPPSPKMVMEENSGLAVAIPIFEAVEIAKARIISEQKKIENKSNK